MKEKGVEHKKQTKHTHTHKTKQTKTNQPQNPKSPKNPDHQKRSSQNNQTKKNTPPPKKVPKIQLKHFYTMGRWRRIWKTTKTEMCLGSLQISQPLLFGQIIFLACTIWTIALILDQQSILKLNYLGTFFFLVFLHHVENVMLLSTKYFDFKLYAATISAKKERRPLSNSPKNFLCEQKLHLISNLPHSVWFASETEC